MLFLSRLFFIVLTFTTLSAHTRCEKATDLNPVTLADFPFYTDPDDDGRPIEYSYDQMQDLFWSFYNQNRRFQFPAFSDSGQYKLTSNMKHWKGEIEVSQSFILAVTSHIEEAIQKQKFARFAFYPDMGHGHILVKEDTYHKEYEPIKDDFTKFYEKAFSDKEVIILYHSGEQADYSDSDSSKQKVLADLKKRRSFYGTISSHPLNFIPAAKEGHAENKIRGYVDTGRKFNFHANKNACFPYQYNGKTLYFDISLSALPF